MQISALHEHFALQPGSRRVEPPQARSLDKQLFLFAELPTKVQVGIEKVKVALTKPSVILLGRCNSTRSTTKKEAVQCKQRHIW